jgi:Flp pilus assembly pilin Flp
MLDRGGGSRRQDGQALVEYGLILAVLALIVIGAMLFLSGGVDRLFRDTGGSATGEFRPPIACDSSYPEICVPAPPPDLDCSDLAERGIPVPVKVEGSDPHDFDPDGDGLGC